MKIEVFDINHIINQIKCASPPSDKDMHKFINNLSILLEKNVSKKNSPLESTLVSTTEKLNELFVDLCFLRKEIIQRFSKEYFEMISNAILQLKANKGKLIQSEGQTFNKINWDLKTMDDESSDIMSVTFSKLQKAKSIIKDALSKEISPSKNPESIVDAFFSS